VNTTYIAALEEELEYIRNAKKNALEGGIEVQTRDGRYKFPGFSAMCQRENEILAILSAAKGNGGYNTVHLKFGGFD